MIAQGRLIVLDTNILILLARGGPSADTINSTFDLGARSERPLCSIVSLGEILRIAARRDWGAQRTAILSRVLKELVVVDLSPAGIVDRYAEIGAAAESSGWAIGQNDLWIAATAATCNAVLITTDKDFDPLHPTYMEREYLDPASLHARP